MRGWRKPSCNGELTSRRRLAVDRSLQLLATLLALLLIQDTAWAECQIPEQVFAEEHLRIASVRLDQSRLLLEPALFLYVDEADELYLPLDELTAALHFPLSRREEHVIEGWYISPERRFRLDADRCQVTLGSQQSPIAQPHLRAHDGSIYVHADAVQRWFPIELHFDPFEQALTVTPLETLPLQRRQERARRWARLPPRSAETDATVAPQELPYRTWDWPFIDVSVEQRLRRGDDGTDYASRYKVVGRGELLGHDTLLAIAGSDNEPVRDITARTGRSHPDPVLLGPLRARHYALGDISIPGHALIARPARARGAEISNFPLHRPREFDRIDLRGELPIGWEVELYHNGRLIDFARDIDHYDFIDVPLQFGTNRFRLVFYGPHGEVREERFQRIVGPGMIRPGEHNYRVIAARTRDDRGWQELTSDDRLFIDYQYGVHRLLSVGGSFRSLEDEDEEQRHYTSLNLSAAAPWAFAYIEAAADDADGRAASIDLSTQIGQVNLTGRSARFSDFDSERTRIGGPGQLKAQDFIGLRSRLPTTAGGIRPSIDIGAQQEDWTQGERTELFGTLAAQSRFWRASQRIDSRRTATEERSYRLAYTRTLLSIRRHRFNIRSELNQQLRPQHDFTSASITADWRAFPAATARVGYIHGWADDTSRVNAGLSWQRHEIAIGTNVSVDDSGQIFAGISASFGLSHSPQQQRWIRSARAQTAAAAIDAEVFLDEDGSGTRRAEEPALADITVRAGGQRMQTDAGGRVHLQSLAPYRPLTVNIDERSVGNPFWEVVQPEAPLLLRPSRTAQLQLPIVPVGRVEGFVSTHDGRNASGIPIQLLDSEGNLVAQTRTAYDGFYTVESVRPGRYLLRAEHTSRRLSASAALAVKGESQQLDLVLTPRDDHPQP
ncbi:hypothetical protein CAI21_08645 [Alkalilimnicola ehrlichii]|uniref:Carboxypeptidase regulatory-like domain-containing protein n=1 Tax=Alkalilimnicola ehrlichii TaxID=351052 RepID=A0A3E0WWD9_9GAMM|nr:carboxypeptidase-like regulatory domain-containing protein [Alkalilimnicola ehrlichii]RFA29892.1 hypothetical protein CAI21_08645 [Alkalilimnicola ehrlichii]RFA36481.1 hypothetical protein CAL65_10915 [Alkalilimnicola ehrlichii]